MHFSIENALYGLVLVTTAVAIIVVILLIIGGIATLFDKRHPRLAYLCVGVFCVLCILLIGGIYGN